MRDVKQKLSIPAEANSRFSSLNLKEVQRGEGRVIGGDQADLRFWGFSVENGETILSSPELIRDDFEGWTDDEVFNVAYSVLMESFASIGVECVEHS